jgi:hypothetical protein
MLIPLFSAVLAFLPPKAPAKPAPPCHTLTEAQMREPLNLTAGCYVLNMSVSARAPITIQPGVTIIAGQEVQFILAEGSSLSAIGTAEKPIVFRGKEHAPGFWLGLQFGSNSPKNRLSYVTVEDAGNGTPNNSGAVEVSVGGRLAIDHSTIRNAKGSGLFANQRATISEFSANHFEQDEVPVSLKANDLGVLDAATTFAGNEHNWVHVHVNDRTVEDQATWRALAIPYHFECSPELKAAVTVEAGARLEFTQNYGIEVEEGGSLTAEGLPGKPVIFTGAEEVPGFWDGIMFHSRSPHNVIRNAVISYAGESSGGLARGAVGSWPRAAFTVASSEIAYSATAAIHVGQDAQLNDDAETSNRFHDNAQGIVRDR